MALVVLGHQRRKLVDARQEVSEAKTRTQGLERQTHALEAALAEATEAATRRAPVIPPQDPNPAAPLSRDEIELVSRLAEADGYPLGPDQLAERMKQNVIIAQHAIDRLRSRGLLDTTMTRSMGVRYMLNERGKTLAVKEGYVKRNRRAND